MKRILELVNEVREKYPSDSFFLNFESSCQENRLKREFYESYEKTLELLDDESWSILKLKAKNQFLNHRLGQLKTGFFNQLNEAFAYRYLSWHGFTNVVFLPETGSMQADLGFLKEGRYGVCEVKSIGISDREIERRSSHGYIDGSVYFQLSPEFLRKLRFTIGSAKRQVAPYPNSNLIYIVIQFDDYAHDYIQNYQAQLEQFVSDNPTLSLVLQLGLVGPTIAA